MNSFQVTAVRVCGLATLALLLVAVAGFVVTALRVESVPSIHTAGGTALLVALTAFIVANVATAATARLVCVGSVLLIAACIALRIYTILPARFEFNVVDGLLTFAVLALLVPLCRSVWNAERDALVA